MAQNSLESDLQTEGQRLLRQIIRAYYPIEFSVLIAGFYRCLSRARNFPGTGSTAPVGVVEGVTSKELAAELKLADKQVQTMLGRLTKEMLIYQTVEEVRDAGVAQTAYTYGGSFNRQGYGGGPHSNRPVTVTKYTVRYEHVVDIVRFKHYEILKALEKQDEGDHYRCDTVGCPKKGQNMSLSQAFLACRTFSINRGMGAGLADPSKLFCIECNAPLTLERRTFDKVATKRRFNDQIRTIAEQTDVVFGLLRDIAELKKSGILTSGASGSTSGSSEKVAPGGKGGLSSAQDLANRAEVKKQRIGWDSVSSETIRLDEAEEHEKMAIISQRRELEEKDRAASEAMRFIEMQSEENREKERLKALEESLFSTGDSNALQNLGFNSNNNEISNQGNVKVEQMASEAAEYMLKQEMVTGGMKTERSTTEVSRDDIILTAPVKGELDVNDPFGEDLFGFGMFGMEEMGNMENMDFVPDTGIENDGVKVETHFKAEHASIPTQAQEPLVSVSGVLYPLSAITADMLDIMTEDEYNTYCGVASAASAQ